MRLLWTLVVALCLSKAFRVFAWRDISDVGYLSKPVRNQRYVTDDRIVENNVYQVRQRIIVERQADYDSNINDMENLVEQEEANSADANNMAGGNGEGWSQWSPWSACSVTCGTIGEKTRQRTCQNDPLSGAGCQGADTDSQTCTPTESDCPKTDSWSAWSNWGECSKTCGDGLKTRERSCVVSDPSLSCPGDSSESQSCNLQSCDLKESWTTWSKWSRCSVSCGEGHKSRERICQDDATKVETSNCPGSKHNAEVCDQQMCSLGMSGVSVKTVHAVEGHSATLKCLYGDMTPPVVIYWLTPDDKRVNHQSSDRNYEAIGDALFIRHAGSNMVGLFRCVVHDAKGKVLMGEAPVDVLDCTSRPCRNGGLCQEIQAVDHYSKRYTTFRCLCAPGYNGPRCEGGLGPGNIAALFMILLLAAIAVAGFCMVCRFRESEKPAKKMISSTQSKLIVVTSREALAASCEDTSSDASLSDSPVHHMNLDGEFSSPPNLKASRGIGSIFPRWGWNNNNSLSRTRNNNNSYFRTNNNTLYRTRNNNNNVYRAVPTQLNFLSKNKGYAYSPVKLTDVSISGSETNTVNSDKSRIDEGDTTNRSTVDLSPSTDDLESTSPSSDTGMGEDVSKSSNSSSTSLSATSISSSSSSSETPSGNVLLAKKKPRQGIDGQKNVRLAKGGLNQKVYNAQQSRHYEASSSQTPEASTTRNINNQNWNNSFNNNINNNNNIGPLVNLAQPVSTHFEFERAGQNVSCQNVFLEIPKQMALQHSLLAEHQRSTEIVNEPTLLLETPKRQVLGASRQKLSRSSLFGISTNVTEEQRSVSACDDPQGRLLTGSDPSPDHPLSGCVKRYSVERDYQQIIPTSHPGHQRDETMFIPVSHLTIPKQPSGSSTSGPFEDLKDLKPSPVPVLEQTAGLSNATHSCVLRQNSERREFPALPDIPELDAVPQSMGRNRCVIPSPHTASAHETEEMTQDDFTQMFQNLRSKLNKEREKVCVKVKRLTSVVSDSSELQQKLITQKIPRDNQKQTNSTDPQVANQNIPTYGEPCAHVTSTPTDAASQMGPPPPINFSGVSPTAVINTSTVSGNCSDGDTTVVYWASPDSPRAHDTLLGYLNHTDSLAKNNQKYRNTDQMSPSEYTTFCHSQDELEFGDIPDTMPLLHC